MAKKQYERPVIVRQMDGLMNKIGRPAPARPFDEIDGARIADMVAEYGSPLFVFSERTLRQKIRDALQTFHIRYPRVKFAWSYKTNYLDAICAIFHQEGSLAEVVSGFEYQKARRLGIPGKEIVFNGPHKTREALELALSEGALVQADNFEEIAAIEEIAATLDRKVDIGIRINVDAGIYPQWDRFGFNYETGQAYHAVKRIAAGGRMNLVSLHCHIGTFILDPYAYGRAVARVIAFADAMRAEFRFPVHTINMGGGFASSNTLLTQYLPGDQSSPSFAQYADSVTAPLLSTAGGANAYNLVLESGRSLVDDAGHLVSTVMATKRLASGRRAIVIDAGLNVLLTALWYKLQVFPAQAFEGIAEETTVYGPLCMRIDCVRETVTLPDLQKGDRVVIKPVGAYCLTQSMQFIALRPACVLVGMDGKVELIRRAETLDDLVGPERLPERLKLEK